MQVKEREEAGGPSFSVEKVYSDRRVKDTRRPVEKTCRLTKTDSGKTVSLY